MRLPTASIHTDRVVRTLTFWLRPAFALRALNRFQRVAGFDRAVALASSALTAMIPLGIVAGSVLSQAGVRSIADRVIDRYELSGNGADAVREVFSPAGGASTSVSALSVLLLVVAVLSFTRAMQRLFEQAWELPSLSMRNTVNGLIWAMALVAYVVTTGWLQVTFGRGRFDVGPALLQAPLAVAFLTWSGWVLSGKRIAFKGFLPFGVVGGALLSVYSVGATVYVPHAFNSYASRYGAIGAVFALISTLFCVAVILVVSAAIGREVQEELERIRRGERPADDEVRRDWDAVVGHARARWQAVRGGARRSSSHR